MNLSKISLLVVPLLALSLLIGTSTAEAFGGRGGGMQGGMRGGPGFGFGPGGQGDNVTVQITKLENGIQTTVTTDDTDVLEQLHAQADRSVLMQSIQHTVTNLGNGVQIEITSDNAEAVTMIQSREQPEGRPRADDVTFSQENIESGVRITITTTDTEQVERIQQMAAGKNGLGMRGGHMGHGPKGRGNGMGGFGRGEAGDFGR